MTTTPRRNLLTDVAGVSVGHADDARLASGVTCVLFEEPVIAACDVRGGGPGTRETDLLDAGRTVEKIDAIVLSGGSAFGLDACAGAQAFLRGQGRGFAIRDVRVPIVPGAALFDLINGGDKAWGTYPPYRELGFAAAEAAAAGRPDFALGSVGAGLGATTVNLKGGLGSASTVTEDGITVAAIAAVNAVGSATVGDGPWFWAGPFEQAGEFGGMGFPSKMPVDGLTMVMKGVQRVSTTLVVVATDAALGRTHAMRLATMAQDGMARALYPIHTPLDGDIVFAAATGRRILGDAVIGLARLGTAAATVVARAIARGVYAAEPLPFPGALPSWRQRYPS
ncbi:P1 family peptidase [Rhodoplanes sp. TEM]|uniref:P1 family peptidase n=1 Tax=Rhodoplanes tepidamans TaxID=200616 RepID=A0ABT5JIL5_RHOTP|nr:MULTISPECIES: P1 family peptidase [Rhodoplanes]MDC7789228.1 P1 family peptidase [Rhodoplanes tepidamans]MDC7985578.1 P1 family peptidase [Rhodoplanes sp. TEM]MDQ0355306.1 D-aminopeptidase [Rhodoplanes tepidamans]